MTDAIGKKAKGAGEQSDEESRKCGREGDE